MIKVLADRVLAFDRGEVDRSTGQLITVRTKIGFCELPDWVGETNYFKVAQADGSLKAFTESGEPESVLKEQEKLAALKAEVAAMEEKRNSLKANVDASPSEDGSNAGETGTTADPASAAKSAKATK